MKSNTLVYVGLLCAIFLVVSWTADAGRAQSETKVDEAKVGKDYYNGGGVGGGGGWNHGGGSHCYPSHGCCGGGWSGCHCCASAEEAKAYALNAAKP